MRRVPHIGTRQTARTRRLTGRWLAAALIVGAVAVLTPGLSYATASQSNPPSTSSASSTSSPAAAGCTGVTPAVFPAQGFITNSGRTQGGHLWWRPSATDTSVCIGTVAEWVQYNVTAAKTWRVIVYSAAYPDGQVVASRTFTLGRGWYFWSFGVHQAYSGLSAVCLSADDSFGVSCLHFAQA